MIKVKYLRYYFIFDVEQVLQMIHVFIWDIYT